MRGLCWWHFENEGTVFIMFHYMTDRTPPQLSMLNRKLPIYENNPLPKSTSRGPTTYAQRALPLVLHRSRGRLRQTVRRLRGFFLRLLSSVNPRKFVHPSKRDNCVKSGRFNESRKPNGGKTRAGDFREPWRLSWRENWAIVFPARKSPSDSPYWCNIFLSYLQAIPLFILDCGQAFTLAVRQRC